jgi:hypothetical protein
MLVLFCSGYCADTSRADLARVGWAVVGTSVLVAWRSGLPHGTFDGSPRRCLHRSG